MVATNEAAPRRQKLRRHCSTCGRIWPVPRTSAYCSRTCERNRGRPPDLDPDEAFLGPVFEERLRLRQQLEDLPRYLHDEVLARLAANERREAAMRERLHAEGARAKRSASRRAVS